MYCTKSDILNQLDEAVLIQLTDDEGTGDIVEGLVTSAIADADAEIDGYCGTRYTVPFTTVPEIIRKMSVDISIYNLFARRKGAPEDRQKRYENAVRFLLNVSKSLVSLGADDPEPTPPDMNTPVLSGNERIFTRGKMSGF